MESTGSMTSMNLRVYGVYEVNGVYGSMESTRSMESTGSTRSASLRVYGVNESMKSMSLRVYGVYEVYGVNEVYEVYEVYETGVGRVRQRVKMVYGGLQMNNQYLSRFIMMIRN